VPTQKTASLHVRLRLKWLTGKVTKVTSSNQEPHKRELIGLTTCQPLFFGFFVLSLTLIYSDAGFSFGGWAGVTPLSAGVLSSGGASLGRYCTMIDTRRLEGSSGSCGVRKR